MEEAWAEAKLGGSPNVNVATPPLNCGGRTAYGSRLGGAGMDSKCREQSAGERWGDGSCGESATLTSRRNVTGCPTANTGSGGAAPINRVSKVCPPGAMLLVHVSLTSLGEMRPPLRRSHQTPGTSCWGGFGHGAGMASGVPVEMKPIPCHHMKGAGEHPRLGVSCETRLRERSCGSVVTAHSQRTSEDRSGR